MITRNISTLSILLVDPMLVNVIDQYYCNQQTDVTNDLVVRYLHDCIIHNDPNSPYCWERMVFRLFTRNRTTTCRNIPIFAALDNSLDELRQHPVRTYPIPTWRLQDYQIESSICRRITSNETFIEHYAQLIEQDKNTDIGIFPPHLAGPDIIITLRRTTPSSKYQQNNTATPDPPPLFLFIQVQCKATQTPVCTEEMWTTTESTVQKTNNGRFTRVQLSPVFISSQLISVVASLCGSDVPKGQEIVKLFRRTSGNPGVRINIRKLPADNFLCDLRSAFQYCNPPCKSILVIQQNINTASESELQAMVGIGPKISSQIIQARQTRPFTSIDDFQTRVKDGKRLPEITRDRFLFVDREIDQQEILEVGT
jgi:hypothetical protein